ncbi:phage major tail tube protein [Sphingomonas morindae]|uniref:Phage major tail tube protein n=1 Tax=Sphingomonas morindae TaxID=1541170 RepID=A0ABY4X6Z9_9SPHN|nr:phage major tail tube protein [Sphingomonas morindae]USI72698.1 phage major tail tube protein [Sphingomonas morindae]
MAYPRILKHMMLFNEGRAYIGEASAITLPKLSRKIEKWRGAGMDGAVPIDLGMGDEFVLEHGYPGPILQVLRQYGTSATLRFAGSYEQAGRADGIEVYARGLHEEIDGGESKPGELGAFKVKTTLSYYRLEWNGVPVIEIDPINMVLTVNGVDLLAAHRANLGI